MKKLMFVAVALCAVSSAFADTLWRYKKTVPTWWYESVTNWTPQAFPTSGVVGMGNWSMGGTVVYLQDGDVVSGISNLKIAYDWTSQAFSLDLRPGSSLSMSGQLALGGEGVQCQGYFTASNATLSIGNGMKVGGGITTSDAYTRAAGYGRVQILDGSVAKVTGNVNIGIVEATPKDCVPVSGNLARFDIVDSDYQVKSWGGFAVGTTGDGAKYRSPVPFNVLRSTLLSGRMDFRGTAAATFRDSAVQIKTADWSERVCQIVLAGHQTQTNSCVVSNSVLVLYRPEWETASGIVGRQWGRWRKVRFASQGYSEFIQDNSVVTNVGVWFWPSQNAGNVYPVKPPKYIVRGGELYVYNSVNYGDERRGYANGSSACGFAAATNAPNSGTISLVDAPKVSYPRVCTNLLLQGAGKDDEWTGASDGPRVFGHTDYRPHFEFVLTKKGQRAMEIREQTDILGMYSFVPQGGLQVVQTNRFALIRHSNKAKTLSTLDEPQFRAPNADLWTTGGFADVPREWGVALKPAAEIVEGADLGAGVASGCVKLPRCNPAKLDKAQVVLKMAPGAKTLAEVAADMTAAGYPATVKGTDEVVVDLLASGMLRKGRNNRLLLDFNAPQDAVGVRDNVKVANALVTKVTTVGMRKGLLVMFH